MTGTIVSKLMVLWTYHYRLYLDGMGLRRAGMMRRLGHRSRGGEVVS